MNKNNALRGLLVLAGLSLSSLALAHGDVTPQAVDTKGLEPLGNVAPREIHRPVAR